MTTAPGIPGTKPPLKIILAAPRGFCAGVDRAVNIVERALEKYGRPIYVRHEIVHNRFVVKGLEDKGAIFVDELDQVPDGSPVIFSAHGVPKSVPAEAARRGLHAIDATCPLVGKVHMEAARHAAEGHQIILIGHAGHPEVVGTMGQVPEGQILLVENLDQAKTVTPDSPDALAYVTQTTLSVDETKDILAVLRGRFPNISAPRKEDICFATTNRQGAVKSIAPQCDAIWVLGAPNSSNSRRLVEVAAKSGCTNSCLLQSMEDIPWVNMDGVRTLGITAGASAPEILVRGVLQALKEAYDTTIHEPAFEEETTSFKLPPELR